MAVLPNYVTEYEFQYLALNPYPANVEKIVAPNNASKQQMGFNSGLKGLIMETP
jgi:hypothetical protein